VRKSSYQFQAETLVFLSRPIVSNSLVTSHCDKDKSCYFPLVLGGCIRACKVKRKLLSTQWKCLAAYKTVRKLWQMVTSFIFMQTNGLLECVSRHVRLVSLWLNNWVKKVFSFLANLKLWSFFYRTYKSL